MPHHPITSTLAVIFFAICMTVGALAFVYAIRMRYGQLMLGRRPDIRWDEFMARVKNVFIYVVAQKRLPRNGYLYSGILHMFIFGAFMVLSIDTINFVTDGILRSFDSLAGRTPETVFHLPLSDGWYQGVADTFRFLCIVGLTMAFINRTVIKPDRLPLTRDALYTLFFIMTLMLAEVFQQGFVMAISGESTSYIWFSSIFAKAFEGMDADTMTAGYRAAWWTHLVTLLAFSNYVPWSKHSHVFAAPLNIFFMSLEPKGALSKMDLGLSDGGGFTDEFVVGEPIEGESATFSLNDVPDEGSVKVFVNDKKFRKWSYDADSNSVSIPPEKHPESGATLRIEYDPPAPEYFGARTIEDLSWKQLFDGLSCTECGRCTDNCPASRSGKPLKPMDIIVDIKHHMEDRYGLRAETVDLTDEKVLLPGTVIDPDVLWSCTTCRACMEVCPVGNEHIPDIIDMRRYLTMSLGEVGHGAQSALKGMEGRGNPWGMPKRERANWTKDVDDIKTWDPDEPSEYLYWVGCAGAYDDRAQKVTKSVSRLMNKAGLDFSILGNEEKCTGDSARRLGNEYLFQTMAEDNVETLNSAGVKKIVTHCPHCLNTLKNEYSQFGGHYDVIHHSELLSKLVADGTLKPQAAEGASETGDKDRVVYHDSCYLGRYNDIYEPQRDIIDALPDVERVEPDRTRQTGLCCGAGGGQMWMEMNIGERMNYVRTDELLAKQPKVIAVACNFCMTMVDDGVKGRGQGESVEVLDLAELLDRRVE